MKVSIRCLDEDLPKPAYAHSGDAGLDLFSTHDVTIDPGGRIAIPTGIAVAIPPGYAGFVHARSGRALNEGLGLANAPGLIDSGYRGEIRVIVVNLDASQPIHVKRGDKIAQLVVQAVEQVELEAVDELPESARRDGGFGSSGR